MIKIMTEYMIDIDLPVPFSNEFLALVPKQRAFVNKLMNEGVITGYALSIESGKLWMTVIAESENTVKELVNSFPVAEHIFYSINKLTFHNSINFKLPSFSLN
jgi:hypothetical protein